MAAIALISDFGTRDWFVAELKGRILSIAPQTTIVDITHEISPGDLRTTAFVLSIIYNKFPPGTIFCQTVDPGTESNRPVIILQKAGSLFVAPDNGTVSWVLSDSEPDSLHRCTNPRYFYSADSTFRGRDTIAPVAAYLSCGVTPDQFGPPVNGYVKIPFPHTIEESNRITTEVICIDHFGNIITAVKNQSINNRLYEKALFTINDTTVEVAVERYYYEINKKSVLLYQGSSGFVEIAVNEGRAAAFFDARVGDVVSLQFR